jgi:hypothetical protein
VLVRKAGERSLSGVEVIVGDLLDPVSIEKAMAEGYLERGFAAQDDDTATLTKLLGHEPRAYEDFANETMRAWRLLENPRAAA